MPISWNEIRHNAIKFSGEWKGATSENAEKQTFWNEFFQVFGIKRRVVASFEALAKRISGAYGFIDLLWRGVLLVEHKSFGEDLGKAKAQAFNYIQDLANEGRHAEIPRYIIVSDFARVALHDLEPEEQRDLPLFDKRRGTTIEFPLADFHKYIHAFAFIPGYKQHTYKEEDPINIEAAEILGNLHDTLEAGGYTGHHLERFLVRILFCLFAHKSLANAESYFDEHLEQNDYYAAGEIRPGQWIGLGAEKLHLKNVFTRDQFQALCENQNPNDNTRLTLRQEKTNQRRVFYDFTCSAPKSVSVLAMTMDDNRLVSAHEEATRIAFRELETFAATRVRKQGSQRDRTTGNLVAAAFTHTSSRQLDPQLHTHHTVFNATFDDTEKRWKAL